MDYLIEKFNAQIAGIERKHDIEIADLKRQVRTSDFEMAVLKRQNEKFERQNEKFERQIRELTNHLSASSPFAESPKTSAAHVTRGRSDSTDGCVICFNPILLFYYSRANISAFVENVL